MTNIFLTPHRAGSAINEVKRMDKFMMREYEKVVKNEDALYEVNLKMLKTMA